jgi:hypothetical protein
MVNTNFNKFKRIQQNHTSTYLGSNKEQKASVNDESYNDQSNSDISIGATGRDQR